MHSKPEPLSRRARLLARPLHYIFQGCASVYLHARRLKYSARHWRQFRAAPTAAAIRTEVDGLTKTPKHISAILEAGDGDEPSVLQKLVYEAVDFVTWSIAAGISTASIYERRGIVKNHAQLIYEAARLRAAEFLPAGSPQMRVLLGGGGGGGGGGGRACYPPPSPGMVDKARFTLHLISEDDGRVALAALTDEFAGQVKCGRLATEEISVSLVAEELYAAIMPAPDLVVAFGQDLVLSGYPPWHLQQAEMFAFRGGCGFCYATFVSALRDFAEAEMRHGK